MSSKNRKKTKRTTPTHRPADSAELSAGNRAVEARPQDEEEEETSPAKVLTLLFGIPTVILIAAVAQKVLQGN